MNFKFFIIWLEEGELRVIFLSFYKKVIEIRWIIFLKSFFSKYSDGFYRVVFRFVFRVVVRFRNVVLCIMLKYSIIKKEFLKGLKRVVLMCCFLGVENCLIENFILEMSV